MEKHGYLNCWYATQKHGTWIYWTLPTWSPSMMFARWANLNTCSFRSKHFMKNLTGFGFFKYNKGYKPTLNQFAGKVLLALENGGVAISEMQKNRLKSIIRYRYQVYELTVREQTMILVTSHVQICTYISAGNHRHHSWIFMTWYFEVHFRVEAETNPNFDANQKS